MRLTFERKFEIDSNFPTPPNLDVAITVDDDTVFAIESKFTEPFGNQRHGGLGPDYLDRDLWSGLERTRNFAKTISPEDNTFKRLHAAQLVKHLLGPKRQAEKGFRLCYLYYDVPGMEGAEHLKEIRKFKSEIEGDGVRFSSISYQDVISWLAERYRSRHAEYVDFITDRYL